MAAPPCPEFELLLERFGDGECDSEDSLRVREHLGACPACRVGLRAITELNRRVAQSATPPTPPDLEARLRQAIRSAGPRRVPAWVPTAAAAVVLVAAAAFLFRPSTVSPPPFVAGGAFFHGRYLATAPAFKAGDPNELRAYFRRALDTDIVVPAFETGTCEEGDCQGGCPCSIDPRVVPWILYRLDTTAVSLIIAPLRAVSLPVGARRSRDGRDYHVFQVKGATALACETRSGVCLWIANLPENELVRCVLQTNEGRDAFAGADVSPREIVCRACCGRFKYGPVTASPGVKIGFLQLTAVGKKGIDLDALIHEGQKP